MGLYNFGKKARSILRAMQHLHGQQHDYDILLANQFFCTTNQID